MLKEIDISQYQLTDHFMIRAYERFKIDSKHLKLWLEDYRFLVDTGLDANDSDRHIVASTDGTTFIINSTQKTLLTCYRGTSPIMSLQMQYQIFQSQLSVMKQIKVNIIKAYHLQNEEQFDHLMQLHHNIVTDTFDDVVDYDETLKTIHHMQRLYHKDLKKIDAYMERLKTNLQTYSEELLQLETLKKRSNPQKQSKKTEKDTLPVYDVTPMHWNPYEFFQLGESNTSIVLQNPLADASREANTLNQDMTLKEIDNLVPTDTTKAKQVTYKDRLTSAQMLKFKNFLQKTYTQAQPDKEEIMLVIEQTPIDLLPASLKRIDGIGDSRKKQILAKLEELIHETSHQF